MTRLADAPAAADAWLAVPRPEPAARGRLFCLPYAGGGAAAFRDWPPALPGLEIVLVRLPGRESRFAEPPLARIEPLVDELAVAVAPRLDRPFALFGHSMGALVAFELARRLRRDALPQPSRLFVSASRAPQLRAGSVTVSQDEDELVSRLLGLGGTPPEVLANEELLGLLLPALRADFALVDAYAYGGEPPLDCPIHAFSSAEDPHATVGEVDAWRAQTRAEFVHEVLSGNHFFVHAQREQILVAIAAELGEAASSAHARGAVRRAAARAHARSVCCTPQLPSPHHPRRNK